MLEPPHPGKVIRELCLEPAGLRVIDAARVVGVSRKALSELLNGHSGISLEMAVRLPVAFAGRIESWLTRQLHDDLARISKKAPTIEVKRNVPALPASWGFGKSQWSKT